MAEYHELRRRRCRDDVELSPEPAREHLDLGGGAWLTVRAGAAAGAPGAAAGGGPGAGGGGAGERFLFLSLK